MMRLANFMTAMVVGAAMSAGLASAQQPGLPDGPGKEQVLKACTACHTITQVTDQRKSQADWSDTVDQMIARGAQVADPDYPVIVQYLSKNLGTTSAAPASPAKP
jgi:hypothetical protein